MARFIADATLVGIVMFTAARTRAWGSASVLLAVLLLVRAVGANAVYRVNLALLHDRAKLPIHAGGRPRPARRALNPFRVVAYVLIGPAPAYLPRQAGTVLSCGQSSATIDTPARYPGIMPVNDLLTFDAEC